MHVTATGVPVSSLVDAVKTAVRDAGISAADADRRVRVTAVQLTLHAVATAGSGAKVEFKIPFLGMNVKLGTTISTADAHTIDIILVPPDLAPAHEIRAGAVDQVLVDAIDTVVQVVADAGGGENPFLLKESTVELSFALTEEGSISLGLDAASKDELTHKLKITVAPTGG
ncbi:trypco2 family protein [Amycolatopsis jiangsuensis]|uniref:Trypsin-co-occurring domain-containing protein n=1 Tax=Amycolatopsis jiangsuensis TaxID=1181879 RepID=A0A840ISS5_9PSEU|nr:trypco2 family protein [Amycolatopsis jiangsuensis]MBB4684873.1 hypothetical protein [Amycolatopsis jiangsuensis]